jgi:putative membrane protein
VTASAMTAAVATMRRPKPGDRLPLILLIVFAAIWIALAIAPSYRQDWLLENLPVAVALPILIASHYRLRFSNAAYIGIFVLMTLHEVGAHYTYSEVPYDDWCMSLLGFSPDRLLGLTRNHYDRVVHLLYGFAVTPAAVELFATRAPPQRIWRWMLPVSFVMSHSVVYELVEWAAAVVFGGDLGIAYLGAQGDPWDAQKDMLLAAVGSVVGALIFVPRVGRTG